MDVFTIGEALPLGENVWLGLNLCRVLHGTSGEEYGRDQQNRAFHCFDPR